MLPRRILWVEVKPDILLSTYKCRVGSARLEDRALSALKTGKIGRGTLNKDHRRHSKKGPDPWNPSGSAPAAMQQWRQHSTDDVIDGYDRQKWSQFSVMIQTKISGAIITEKENQEIFAQRKIKVSFPSQISALSQRVTWYTISHVIPYMPRDTLNVTWYPTCHVIPNQLILHELSAWWRHGVT